MKKLLTATFALAVVASLGACSGMHRTYTDTPYDGRTAGEGTAVYGSGGDVHHADTAAKMESKAERK